MTSAIIFYSYSGNTKKVAQILAEVLKEKGAADLIELNTLDESKSFLGQCLLAFSRARAKLAPVNFDLYRNSGLGFCANPSNEYIFRWVLWP